MDTLYIKKNFSLSIFGILKVGKTLTTHSLLLLSMIDKVVSGYKISMYFREFP